MRRIEKRSDFERAVVRNAPSFIVAAAVTVAAAAITIEFKSSSKLTLAPPLPYNHGITNLTVTCVNGYYSTRTLRLSTDTPYDDIATHVREKHVDPKIETILQGILGDDMRKACDKRPASHTVQIDITEEVPEDKRKQAGNLIRRLVQNVKDPAI